MAQATTRRTSSARRSTRKSGSSAGTRSTARKTSNNGRARTARKTSSSRPRSASSARRNSRPRSATRSKASTNGVAGTLSGVGNTVGSTVGKVGDSVGTAAQKAKVPAIVGTAAVAGLAGGVALGSRMLSKRNKSGRLPIGGSHPLKSVVREAQSVGKEIGKTGFRVGLGDVNMEVKSGNKSDKRDSPLEVLIKGLTSRHTASR